MICTPLPLAPIISQDGQGSLIQQGHSGYNNPHLKLCIVRSAQRIAQWVTDKQGPRRTHPPCNLWKQRNRHGRDSRPLDNTLNQPDGLMAHRSDRRKQNRIDLILQQHPGNLRRGFCNHPPRRRNRPHEAEMTWRNRSNRALLCQFL